MPKKSRQRSRPRARAHRAARPTPPPPVRETSPVMAPSVKAPSVKAAPSPGPTPPQDPLVLRELRKIGLIAAALFALLVVLYFVWR